MSLRGQIEKFRRVASGRFLFLLVALLLYIGILPVLEKFKFFEFRLLIDIAFTAIFISAVYAVSINRRQGTITTLLVLPTLTLVWVSYYTASPGIVTAKLIFTIVFLTLAIFRIMGSIFRAQRVSRDVIFAAIVVYLIIGLDYSVVYQLLEHLLPGSLDSVEGPMAGQKYLYTYFSFVTLTTLGFGDVTPLTGIAGSLTIMEAVIGQLFTTVLIARLVGMHVSDSQSRNKRVEPKNDPD